MTNLLLNFPSKINSFPTRAVMKLFLLFYNSVLIFVFITIGLLGSNFDNFAPALLLLPVGVYFSLSLSSKINKISGTGNIPRFFKLKRILYFYSLLIIILLIISTLVYSSSFVQFLMTLIFLPFLFYFFNSSLDLENLRNNFLFLVKVKNKKYDDQENQTPVVNPEVVDEVSELVEENEDEGEDAGDDRPQKLKEISDDSLEVTDHTRRKFLKVIGGSGFSLIIMLFLMPQKASASFFGSNPSPGLVAIKDTDDNKIDPAVKGPTDGYNISEIDDDALPSYYGFIHKDGAWYISKESSAGAYRYAAGASSFSTNWTNRASLSYDYFDNVF